MSTLALAQHLGVEPRTVKKRLADLPPDEERKTKSGVHRRWKLARVIEHLRRPGAAEGDLDLEAERARLAKEQADKTALDNAVRRGELLEVKAVERAWGSIMVAIRQRLLALPSELAPELATITDANRIRDRLTAEVHAVLAEATSYRVDPAGLDDQGPGDAGALDTEAPAPVNSKRVGRRAPQVKPRKQRKGRPLAH